MDTNLVLINNLFRIWFQIDNRGLGSDFNSDFVSMFAIIFKSFSSSKPLKGKDSNATLYLREEQKYHFQSHCGI